MTAPPSSADPRHGALQRAERGLAHAPLRHVEAELSENECVYDVMEWVRDKALSFVNEGGGGCTCSSSNCGTDR